MTLNLKLRFLLRALRYRWKLDPAELQWLRSAIKPGQLAVDIGAHKGAYSFWMLRSTGAAGQVIAFEPQRELAEYLESVRAAFKWDSWRIENCGVSDHAGESVLHVPSGGPSPGASLEASKAQEGEDSVRVKLVKLDDYVGTRTVGLIKLDVEGHELAVLKGAKETLRRDRPALLMECERRHRSDGSTSAVFEFLNDLGYQGAFFKNQQSHPLTEFDESRHQQDPDSPDYVNNFCFRHFQCP